MTMDQDQSLTVQDILNELQSRKDQLQQNQKLYIGLEQLVHARVKDLDSMIQWIEMQISSK
jgi:transposase